MKIRPYQETDAECTMTLYNETNIIHNFPDFSKKQKDVMLHYDIAIFNETMLLDTTLIIIIEKTKKIVGFIMMKDDGYINYLYVKYNSINSGYGKNLIKEIEKIAKNKGITKLSLFATKYASKNKIYEKLGFTNLGLNEHYINGILFELNKMEKSLI
ncbi:MAG: GNAT family N-acetyltransferase [Candidatus Gracilibacteria bacterium]|nr:GNAT family N-acetyltransferase [Candidatus Gracilibacteria bacterium]